MYCNNCGKRGHLYKECKLPVTSCGNIVFRVDNDEPEILMIQRKDSLCYIDFVRGKYDIQNINYIQTLINKCSLCDNNFNKIDIVFNMNNIFTHFDCLFNKLQ